LREKKKVLKKEGKEREDFKRRGKEEARKVR